MESDSRGQKRLQGQDTPGWSSKANEFSLIFLVSWATRDEIFKKGYAPFLQLHQEDPEGPVRTDKTEKDSVNDANT